MAIDVWTYLDATRLDAVTLGGGTLDGLALEDERLRVLGGGLDPGGRDGLGQRLRRHAERTGAGEDHGKRAHSSEYSARCRRC